MCQNKTPRTQKGSCRRHSSENRSFGKPKCMHCLVLRDRSCVSKQIRRSPERIVSETLFGKPKLRKPKCMVCLVLRDQSCVSRPNTKNPEANRHTTSRRASCTDVHHARFTILFDGPRMQPLRDKLVTAALDSLRWEPRVTSIMTTLRSLSGKMLTMSAQHNKPSPCIVINGSLVTCTDAWSRPLHNKASLHTATRCNTAFKP